MQKRADAQRKANEALARRIREEAGRDEKLLELARDVASAEMTTAALNASYPTMPKRS